MQKHEISTKAPNKGEATPAEALHCLALAQQNPNSLILGTRTFAEKNVPLKSKARNFFSTLFYWGAYTLLFGQDLPVYYYHEVVEARSPKEAQVAPLVTQIEAGISTPTHARVFIADTNLSNEGYCYLHYLLAPISTIDYMSNDNSEGKDAAEISDQAQSILDSIIETHCNYAYFGNTYAEQLAAIAKDQDSSLAPNTLYRIETTEDTLSFTPVD